MRDFTKGLFVLIFIGFLLWGYFQRDRAVSLENCLKRKHAFRIAPRRLVDERLYKVEQCACGKERLTPLQVCSLCMRKYDGDK